MSTHPKPSPKKHRLLVFVGLSLLSHLVVAGAMGGVSMDLDLPKPSVTWLDLDNTLGAPTPSKAPPTKTAKPPKSKTAALPAATRAPWSTRKRIRKPKKKKVAKKRRVKRDAGVRPDAGPFTTDKVALGTLAPGDAALMLLLRMDRLRKSPYEEAVRRLLEVFYDHKTLLWTSGMDPIQDFDAMLIATPNPYRVTRTFLAVHHSLPPRRVRRGLSRAARYQNKRMRWRRHGSVLHGQIPSPPRHPRDPRVVVLRRNVVMLTDPAHIPLLSLRPESTARRAPDAGVEVPWVQRLEQMEGMGGSGKEGPGLLLQAINLPRLVRLPPDFTTPQSFKLTIPATDPSDLHALIFFATPADARTFLAAVPRRIKQAKRSLLLRLLGVTSLLESIQFKRRGTIVDARVQLSGEQVNSLLGIFRNMIPQVRVPGMQQNRIPDTGVPDSRVPDARVPDAGVPDRGAPDAGMPDAGASPDVDPTPGIVKPSWAN